MFCGNLRTLSADQVIFLEELVLVDMLNFLVGDQK